MVRAYYDCGWRVEPLGLTSDSAYGAVVKPGWLPSNQRMHQPGRGRAVVSGRHSHPVLGGFPETRRVLQAVRGRHAAS